MRSTCRTALLPVLVLVLSAACGPNGAGAGEPRPNIPDARNPAPESEAPGPDLPLAGTAWVIFGADTVVAEIARTPEERQEGLMYRESLEENAGMLFVFDRAEVRSFWMQNTYIPLDIAYLDSNMAIINILAMTPQSNDLYESEAPALFALEVNQGWFAAHGIDAGDRAEIVFNP